MVRIVALILMAFAVLVPGMADANTRVTGDSDSPILARYQSWIDNALVPSPNTRVTVRLELCPDPHAAWCMSHGPGPITIWTAADMEYLWGDGYSESDRLGTQLDFLHEIGHVFDFSPGPKGYRRVFARIMGHRKGTWAWATGGNSLHEQFAMAYAFCAMWPHYDGAAYARTVWWGYDYNPTPQQYERACYAIHNPAR